MEVIKAYMAGDKSTAQLAAEYNVAKSTITEWAKKYDEECHYKRYIDLLMKIKNILV